MSESAIKSRLVPGSPSKEQVLTKAEQHSSNQSRAPRDKLD